MLAERSSRISTSRAPPVAAAARSGSTLKNGRVNAAMMSAIAAARSNSSGQLWIRRRSTDWYGIFRRNINEGKWTTFFRSRWMR